MSSSRLFHATMMLFWISLLSLLAAAVTYAPKGGAEIMGLHLFAGAGIVDQMTAAMQAIGLSVTAQGIVLGLIGGFNVAAAGLLLFAMMFRVFGEEREQREAVPLAEGAAASTAVAAGLTVAFALAGGHAGALMGLELAALAGLVLTVAALAQNASTQLSAGETELSGLDDIIAEHAASHAAFSAELASLARRGSRP